jgi:hypothetical protein
VYPLLLPSQLMKLINFIEEKECIDYSFWSVDLWPVIRNSLMAEDASRKEKIKKKTPLLKKIWASFDFLKLYFKSGNKDVLIFTDCKFSCFFEGKLNYKEATIISELSGANNKTSMLLSFGITKGEKKASSPPSLFFILFLAYLIANIICIFPLRKISKYVDGIYHEVSGARTFYGDMTVISKKVTVRNIFIVLMLSIFFKALLKKLKPQECYVVCYYSLAGMALCSACNQLGIPITDIQHGVSGKNMRAYGQWRSVGSKGYNTLPSLFNCWTTIDANAINSWAFESSGKHKAVVTGNIWSDFIFKSPSFLQVIKKFSDFEESLKVFNKKILISTQSIDLAPLILSVLKDSPRDYAFLIRMHPDINHIDLLRIEKKLKKINPSIFVVNATELYLQQVIRYADVHITEWSAVVYDCMLEGVVSIVVDEVGADYFSDFDSSIIAYANSVEKILEIVAH